MSEGSGKTIGAAAAGAGGVIALLLKAGSAEVHMAGAGARAASVAGRETVQVGMAGERALAGGARVGGAAGAAAAENAVVRAAAGAHFLEGLTPTSRATLEAFGD